MKNNLITLFLFILTLILGTCNYILYNNNSEITKQVNERDSLIKSSYLRDSITSIKTQKNAEIITKYVNDCSLEIDGKKISLEEFVKLLNDAYHKNYLLQDSLINQKTINTNLNSQVRSLDLKLKISETRNLIIKDSLEYSNKIIGNFKKQYGIDYDVKVDDKYRVFQFKRSTVDSALILFPYFKDKLKYDSAKKVWIIIR